MRKRTAFRTCGRVAARAADLAWQVLRGQPQAAASWRPVTPMAAVMRGWHAALRVADFGIAPAQHRVAANARPVGVTRR